MPWTIHFDAVTRVVELTFVGVVPRDELEVAARAALEQAAEQSTRLILADLTRLEGGHSITDLFFLAEELEASGTTFREALLLPEAPQTAELAEFWPITAGNRGLDVEAFRSRADAERWLLRDP
ncbi:hypothetical protein L6R52_16035 [Myxococcota bacterium]|nr:hypothetical protein [Myxococcota bacterium]